MSHLSLEENYKCKHNLTGGGKISFSLSSYMRLHALIKSVCRAAVFMFLLVLPVACQHAHLIPEDEAETNSRGKNEPTEEPADSTIVTPSFDVNGWQGSVDAEFSFGANEQEGGEE